MEEMQNEQKVNDVDIQSDGANIIAEEEKNDKPLSSSADPDLDEDAAEEVQETETYSGPVVANIEIPDQFTAYTDKEEVAATAIYSTGRVAKKLGVHRNLVRAFAENFYDVLPVVKDPSNNQYKYTEEAVRQIAFLINDRLDNHRTIQQEADYINSTLGRKTTSLATNTAMAFETMFNAMQATLFENQNKHHEEQMSAIREGLLGNEQLRLEDKSSMEAMQNEFASQMSELRQQMERLEQKQDQAFAEKEKQLSEALSSKDKQIMELQAKLEATEKELEESKKKKKFRLFG